MTAVGSLLLVLMLQFGNLLLFISVVKQFFGQCDELPHCLCFLLVVKQLKVALLCGGIQDARYQIAGLLTFLKFKFVIAGLCCQLSLFQDELCLGIVISLA